MALDDTMPVDSGVDGTGLLARADSLLGLGGSYAGLPQALLTGVLTGCVDPGLLEPMVAYGLLDPSALFDIFTIGRLAGYRSALQSLFAVVNYPRQRLQGLQSGDILVRRALGEPSVGHAAFIADPSATSPDDARMRGLAVESMRPGLYAHVVEAGTRPHGLAQRFARRIAGPEGLLPADTLILRPQLSLRMRRGLAEDSDAGIAASGSGSGSGSGAGSGTGSGTSSAIGNGAGSGVAPVAPPAGTAAIVPPYGGYDLRFDQRATRTDSDTAKRWGGTVRAAPSPLPAAGQPGFVSQLQRDLRTLGFRLVANTGGVFDLSTFWSVREFQIYAGLSDIAQEAAGPAVGRYVDRLTRTGNPQRYNGPISGVVNADTRTLLQLWLTNRFRCPVVVDALLPDASGNFTILRAENIWDRRAYPHSDARMFARDFTFQYAPFPAGHNQDDPIVLGDFVTFGAQSGPSSEHSWAHWPTSEMTPETLAGAAAGAALGTLDPPVQACYRVIRAVAEVECSGFFDEINAYDDVFISQGPFHNPIGAASDASGGELCGVLSEFLANDAAGYDDAFGRFGIRPKKAWGSNGQTLINTVGQRRFLTTLTLSNEAGGFDDMDLSAANLNMLRSWHWFYRFEMAGRTSDPYRRAFWRASRARLRALILTSFGHGVADVPSGGGAGTRPAVIWDLYTSELALALILRWHVRFPAHMVSGFVAGTHLNNAFQNARVGGNGPAKWGPPSAWTDAHEQALIDALMAEVAVLANPGLSQTMTTVHNFPGLDASRGSFHMDTTDLGNAV